LATHYPTHSRPLSDNGVRAEALLNRYPEISDRELDELIDIFPKLPILDVGLITGDERIAAKVADLYKAHGKRLKSSKTSLIILLVAFLVVPLATVAVFWLL
jgi:hypothetical protein